MSFLFFKVLHIFGLLLIFTTFGGLLLHAVNGGDTESNRGRKLAGITHGFGLLLMLISGFAMIAAYGYGFPLWVWLKIVIWFLLGAMGGLIRRFPGHAKTLWLLLPLLGAAAAYLAIFKPGA